MIQHKNSVFKLFLTICVILVNTQGFGQYYYKDILSVIQTNTLLDVYKNNKVRKISIKSFESDESQSEGFFCEKIINKAYTKSELVTTSMYSGKSVMTSYFGIDGKFLSSIDSSDISVSKNEYEYNKDGSVASVKSIMISKDEDFATKLAETHLYFYENGHVTKMQKIVNNIDTTEFIFALDDSNNIAIEKNTKTGSKFYYYYDSKNRLTDIVVANNMNDGLKPNYVFAYNSSNFITQMITNDGKSANYALWKYAYDGGLRISERCYNKDRKLLGSIIYEYK